MIIQTNSDIETEKLGVELGVKATASQIYCLTGEIGAGKTVFAKGFAQGLGIKEAVVSPTFTIFHIYENGRLPLYHFDVYRIREVSEMEEIGYEDFFYGAGVTLIEWAEQIKDIIPQEARWISIQRVPELHDDARMISIDE